MKYKYIFVEESWEDYLYWQRTDKKLLKKINELLKNIARHPFEGIGKPEPLKHKYTVSVYSLFSSEIGTGLSA